MADPRNSLFLAYKHVLQTLRPDGFVFENVTGLQSMEGGRVFEMVMGELASAGFEVDCWKLQAEHFGIPQRRTRLFIIGRRPGAAKLHPPESLTSMTQLQGSLWRRSPAVTVLEALGDLPALQHSQDGSDIDYATEPLNTFQAFVRGHLTPEQYVESLRARREEVA